MAGWRRRLRPRAPPTNRCTASAWRLSLAVSYSCCRPRCTASNRPLRLTRCATAASRQLQQRQLLHPQVLLVLRLQQQQVAAVMWLPLLQASHHRGRVQPAAQLAAPRLQHPPALSVLLSWWARCASCCRRRACPPTWARRRWRARWRGCARSWAPHRARSQRRATRPLPRRRSWRGCVAGGAARSASRATWTPRSRAAGTCYAWGARAAWTGARCAASAPRLSACTSDAVAVSRMALVDYS
mmetsp:Transcript_28718/g.73025  ORF Transcript_28718/g.73025 Transcript_28718/m.73025 type:complete len:242 (+) Transcript_28718:2683-3408(+)